MIVILNQARVYTCAHTHVLVIPQISIRHSNLNIHHSYVAPYSFNLTALFMRNDDLCGTLDIVFSFPTVWLFTWIYLGKITTLSTFLNTVADHFLKCLL
jgi:hypothetical protein